MRQLFNYDGPVARWLTKAGDCICASVLWLVFCIPIITIGASSAALYTAAYRTIRLDEGSGLWPTFWKAFRENLKRSTLTWLVSGLLLVVLTVDVTLLRRILQIGDTFGFLYWPSLVIWCLVLTWNLYVSGYAARFDGSVREVLKFSGMMMMLHPLKALKVAVAIIGALALTLMVPFMGLILPAAVFWLASYPMEEAFLAHMRPEDAARMAEEEEARQNGGSSKRQDSEES